MKIKKIGKGIYRVKESPNQIELFISFRVLFFGVCWNTYDVGIFIPFISLIIYRKQR